MRTRHIMTTAILCLAACEKYTDATSPCFGKNDEPVVSRAATSLLAYAEAPPGKDCIFEPIGMEP